MDWPLHQQMAQMFPVLDRFVNSWPVLEMLKQFMRNKRKHSVHCGYIPPRAERRLNATQDGPPRKRAHVHINNGSQLQTESVEENDMDGGEIINDGDMMGHD